MHRRILFPCLLLSVSWLSYVSAQQKSVPVLRPAFETANAPRLNDLVDDLSDEAVGVTFPSTSGTQERDSLRARLRLTTVTGSGVVTEASNNAAHDVRFDSDVPSLRVSTEGPDTLVVGRSAVYVITLNNQSGFAANGVVVRCLLPTWVDLTQSKASRGGVDEISHVGSQPQIVWNIDSVAAEGQQQLQLELVPRAGKAFELNVDVAVQPKNARTKIAVKEPLLKLAAEGPTDIVYRTHGLWDFTLENPGTGDAENVELTVQSGSRELAKTKVGVVPAGGRRSVELIMDADDIGRHDFTATVTGSLGLKDTNHQTFLVRRGNPVVRIQGSDFEFAGTESTYDVTVSNSGNAIMRDVSVELTMPASAKYVRGLENPTVIGNTVQWSIRKVAPGAEFVFPIEIELREGGDNEFDVDVITADDVRASDAALTHTATAADLKLVVVDPKGPRAVGAITEYEIHVANEGTDTARQISVIAICPPEMEPVDVSGSAAIKSGQIFFHPIPEIASAHKVVHKVKVRANESGNHSFRVVVQCYEPQMRFASEETTRYFDRPTRVPEVVTQKQDDTIDRN